MANPYLVANNSGLSSGATTYTVPVTTATNAGDGVVVLVGCGGTAAPAVSAVTVGGVAATIQRQYSAASPIICVATSPGTAALTTSSNIVVTFASAATGAPAVIACATPGMGTVDVSVATALGSSTAPLTGSGTPAASGEIALGLFVWANAGGTGSVNSPFTELGQASATGGSYATISYEASPGSGSALTAGATITSNTWRAVLLTMEPTAASVPLIWFTNAAFIGNLNSSNAATAAQFFNPAVAARPDGIPTAFALSNSAGSPVSLPAGYTTTPCLKYISYGQFWADVTGTQKTVGTTTYTPVAGGIDPSYRWLMYDTEDWNPNPPSPYTQPEDQKEIDDPWTYMQDFVTLAHAHNFKVLLPPARDLGNDATSVHPLNSGESIDAWVVRVNLYGSAAGTGADIAHVQAQADQTNGTYQSFFTSCYNQAIAAAPSTPVTAGVSTTSAGSPTATDMFNAAQSVLPNAAGFWLNMSSATAGEAISFLQMMAAAAPPPGPTAVALADSGGGTEALGTAAQVPLPEAGGGAGTLSVQAASVAVVLPEAGGGAGTLGTAAQVPLAAAGSAAEALSVGAPVAVPLAEAGSGAEALSVAAPVVVTGADLVRCREAAYSFGGDWVAAREAGSVALIAPVTPADAGSAVDALAVRVLLADSGSAAEALTARSGLVEAGSGAESLSVRVLLPEAGAAAETLAAGFVLPDSGGGADALFSSSSTAPHSADVAHMAESAFSYRAAPGDLGQATESGLVRVRGADGVVAGEVPLRAWPASGDAVAGVDAPLHAWRSGADAARAADAVGPFRVPGAGPAGDLVVAADRIYDIGIWTFVPVRLRFGGKRGEAERERAAVAVVVARLPGLRAAAGRLAARVPGLRERAGDQR